MDYPNSHIAWHKKKSVNRSIFETFVYLILVTFSVIFMIPFVWLLSSSLKTNTDVFTFPPQWIPHPMLWSNYVNVLTIIPFFSFLKNTLIITVTTLLAETFISAFVAYGFARLRAPGKNLLFWLVLCTMMMPGQVTMIPLFIMFKQINWVDTLKPLIVPSFFGGSAFYIFLMRQFFMTIPKSLDDAAKIDGCGFLRIFWHIILASSNPVLGTVAVFSFMAHWNDFMGPLIYLNSIPNYTLALGVNLFQTQFTTQWNYIMAYTVLMILPTIVIFFFAQRKYIQGIVITGIK